MFLRFGKCYVLRLYTPYFYSSGLYLPNIIASAKPQLFCVGFPPSYDCYKTDKHDFRRTFL